MNNQKQKGFTLIETFVAITILLITVLGPFSLLSGALADASALKNKMIAGYLAQEGVEAIFRYRDENKTALLNLTGTIYYTLGDDDEPTPCPSNCSEPLKYDSTGYGPGKTYSTTFSREVKVTSVDSTSGYNQLLVEATVNWQEKNLPHHVSSLTYFFVRP